MITIFILLNLINVILGTMRSVLTVKASPTVAMLINTVSYTFYSGIVKLISGYNIWIVVVTTAVTNIVGVYIAKLILKKTEKQKLYIFDITCDYGIMANSFEEALKVFGIGYKLNELKGNNCLNFTAYAYSKKDTHRIVRLLEIYGNDFHYNMVKSETFSK